MAAPLRTIKQSEALSPTGRPEEREEMKLSRKYMNGETFRALQTAFDFFNPDTVDFLRSFIADCRAGWTIKTPKKATETTQRAFPFMFWCG